MSHHTRTASIRRRFEWSFSLAALLLGALVAAEQLQAQLITFSSEQLVKYTGKSTFERFPDGRPKVPDELLEHLRQFTTEEITSPKRLQKSVRSRVADPASRADPRGAGLYPPVHAFPTRRHGGRPGARESPRREAASPQPDGDRHAGTERRDCRGPVRLEESLRREQAGLLHHEGSCDVSHRFCDGNERPRAILPIPFTPPSHPSQSGRSG